MKRYSAKREAILNLLRSTDTHPSAEWIYAQLKPSMPDLSLATVYRNIAGFLEDGSIIRVGTVNGRERYDGTVIPHNHFICTHCGRVLDIDYVMDDSLNEKVAAQIGMQITGHELIFHGICRSCVEH